MGGAVLCAVKVCEGKKNFFFYQCGPKNDKCLACSGSEGSCQSLTWMIINSEGDCMRAHCISWQSGPFVEPAFKTFDAYYTKQKKKKKEQDQRMSPAVLSASRPKSL